MENTFESKVEVNEKRYIDEIKKSIHKKTWKVRYIGVIVLFIFLIPMFLWKYTIGLAVFILLVFTVIFILTKVIRNDKITSRLFKDSYKEMIIIHEPIIYGFNDYNLFVKGEYLTINVAWHLIKTYSIGSEWVRVSTTGLIPFYYSIAEMKEQGIYNHFKLKLEMNGKQV